MPQRLSLRDFCREKYPWFKVDEHCQLLVTKLEEYAYLDPAFETDPPKSWQLEGQRLSCNKGLYIFGNVGSGKSDLMRVFQQYLFAIGSPFMFRLVPVREVTKKYRNTGSVGPIDQINSGHWLFDDLSRTDEQEMPVRFYDYSVVISHELIDIRYEMMSAYALITHFTGNKTPGELFEHFPQYLKSRFTQMVNFIPYIGPDRRLTEPPHVFVPVVYADINTLKSAEDKKFTSLLDQ